MARAPRSSVSKTSGQGVARKAYQGSYQMGPRASMDRLDLPDQPSGKVARSYGKGEKSDINVSYGDTLPISTLDDVDRYAKEKPAKGLSLVPKKAKKLK